jgi:TP901 family phage tail tape measure protein
MAQQFNLTAQINLQSPKNVGRVVSDIQRQLKGSGLNSVNIKVKADPRSMAQTNKQLQNVSKNSRAAAKDISTLNRNLQEATRRFSVITIATGTLLSLVTGFKNATKAAVEFERELIKISQVTGKSVQQLQGLTKEVTRLSTSFGVSSADLLNVSRTLAQAGFAADQTRKALDILAKTTLAATFDNIQDTTEGAIALLRQFGNEAKAAGGDIKFLEKSLDAINAVSKSFAVESGDLITVIRRVGGVFSSAGGSINELIALFTSVRSTTRESAETIATGLRTIFTRIQRTETIEQLKSLNIQLQDSQGRFVGAFEAVRRLSQGLSALDPRDFRFSQIVEELGGFRQIGKVIPLIQQFAVAQDALNVAQGASGSTAADAAKAQLGLGVQIQKVREEFAALIRKFTDSGPFNSIATGALKIASAMIKVAEAVEPLLPLLTTMFGLKLGRSLAPGLASLAGVAGSGRGGGGAGFSKFARGGVVPGSGNRDTVPAMLTPGEFVIKKSSVKKIF